MIAPGEDVDTSCAEFLKRGPGHPCPVRRVFGVCDNDTGSQLSPQLWKQAPYNGPPRAAEDVPDEQYPHDTPLSNLRTAKTLALEGQRASSD
jgi:hypothetical protein